MTIVRLLIPAAKASFIPRALEGNGKSQKHREKGSDLIKGQHVFVNEEASINLTVENWKTQYLISEAKNKNLKWLEEETEKAKITKFYQSNPIFHTGF